jgi:hypothetical protein
MKDLANRNLIWWTIPSCAQKPLPFVHSLMDEDLGCGMCSSHISHRKGIVTLFLTQFITSSYIYILGIGPNTHTPSYFLPFLLSCNLFSARFNFLVTGRKLFWDETSKFWCPYDTLNCCVWTLLCSPESWIVVNSHIIQIRIDLCAPLQTALYMPRTCRPPNVDVVFKIHLHLKLYIYIYNKYYIIWFYMAM